MGLSNYPPGHPTGFDRQELEITCSHCGAVTYAVQEIDRATNAVDIDPFHCEGCSKEFTNAALESAEPV